MAWIERKQARDAFGSLMRPVFKSMGLSGNQVALLMAARGHRMTGSYCNRILSGHRVINPPHVCGVAFVNIGPCNFRRRRIVIVVPCGIAILRIHPRIHRA